MQIILNSWHVLSSALVFTIGLFVALFLSRRYAVYPQKAILLYLWHTIFCFLYLFYSLYNQADSIGYYKRSLTFDWSISLGTDSVDAFSAIFSQGLGFSYLGLFLVFNIIGFIGFSAFYAVLSYITLGAPSYITRISTVIIFLPSVSFWSSALGKDAFSFMSVGLALWASLDLKRYIWLMVFAIVLMLIVRPHMSGLMVIALSLALFFQPGASPVQRFLYSLVAAGGAILLVPLALSYAGVGGDAQVSDLVEYIEQRQKENLDGASSVDINNMSLVVKLFTYFFRPLPFEAHNFAALAASLDNVVLLLMLFLSLRLVLKRKNFQTDIDKSGRIFLWTYSFSAWVILSMTTANLGIAMRQKWMFAPMLIVLTLSALSRAYKSDRILRSNPRLS